MNKHVQLSLKMEARGINLHGELVGMRVLVKGTKGHVGSGTWYSELLNGIRALGFTVEEIPDPPPSPALCELNDACHLLRDHDGPCGIDQAPVAAKGGQ